jgi:hypothetical protein
MQEASGHLIEHRGVLCKAMTVFDCRQFHLASLLLSLSRNSALNLEITASTFINLSRDSRSSKSNLPTRQPSRQPDRPSPEQRIYDSRDDAPADNAPQSHQRGCYRQLARGAKLNRALDTRKRFRPRASNPADAIVIIK